MSDAQVLTEFFLKSESGPPIFLAKRPLFISPLSSSGLSVRSFTRLGSRATVIDYLTLGSALSVRQFTRCGSGFSVLVQGRIGKSFSVYDFLACGSSLSMRSLRLRSGLSQVSLRPLWIYYFLNDPGYVTG